MTNEEIVKKVTEHEVLIKTQEKEIAELKETTKEIHTLVTNVELIAQSTKSIVEEQKKQGLRLEKIEQEPSSNWSNAKRTAMNTIISTIAGALAVGLILMIANVI